MHISYLAGRSLSGKTTCCNTATQFNVHDKMQIGVQKEVTDETRH